MPHRPPEALRPNLAGRLLRVGLLGTDGVLGDPETDGCAQEDRARLSPHKFCREDGAESGSPETEQPAEDPRASSSLSPGSLPGFFEGLFEAATSLGAAAVLALARLERQAQNAQRGLRKQAGTIPPWKWRDINSGRGEDVADKDCSDFSTHSAAQSFFERHQPGDPHDLNGDGDGVACEGLQ